VHPLVRVALGQVDVPVQMDDADVAVDVAGDRLHVG
jgi:hypothetical protein